MHKISLRRRIRAKVVVFIFNVLSCFSLKTLYRCAIGLASVVSLFPSSPKRIATQNIALCFPELSLTEQNLLVKNTLKQNIATMLELSYLWLNDYEKIKQSISDIHLPDEFKEDQKTFSQMIFITPHFGSWEMSGLYASSLYPLTTLYRPSRLYIDPMIIKGRGKNSAILVPTNQQGIREMIKTMRAGRSVGILPDQDPGEGEGIFSPFFGLPTKTIVLVSKLAQRFKIPAYIVASKRNLETAKFDITLIKIDDALQNDDLQCSVDTLNQAIESVIRTAPEQYLWTYKRFKSTPEGESPRYPS